MNENERRELAAVFAADDEFRKQREAADPAAVDACAGPVAAAPVRKFGVAAGHDEAPSDGDDAPADDGQDEYAAAIERFAEVVTRRLDEDDRELAELKAKNIEISGLLSSALEKFAELRGRVDTLAELLGRKSKLWMP